MMSIMMTRFWVSLGLSILIWAPVSALAAAMPEYTVTIKEHRFDPAQTIIPADTKVKLVIDNQDAAAEEFESFELNREKIVAGKHKIIVFVGPVKAGSYKYFGDFHKDTAQGTLVVK